MRRGRITLFLVLILVVVGVVVVALYLKNKQSAGGGQPQATPTPSTVSVVIAGQNIALGAQVTADMLETTQIPQEMQLATYFTDINAVIGQYAKYPLDQSMFITTAMVTSDLNAVQLPGSRWSTIIPKGKVAIAIPVTRLSAAAYGIRDGDHIDVIVSMLLVDIDAEFQSILPNNAGAVLPQNGQSILVGGGNAESASGELKEATSLTAQPVSGLTLSPFGRVVQDPNLQAPFYVVPSESQRPRLVSQLIIKNVKVLHIGTFPLAGEDAAQSQPAGLTPTPDAQGVQPTPTKVVAPERPDIITLIVEPQEAVTLTYLMFGGAKLTLVLRNPTDEEIFNTEAATLQFIFGQYNIPVPAKESYGLHPRIDAFQTEILPNDIIVITPVP